MCDREMIMKRGWKSRGTTNEDGRDKPERARQSLSFKRKDDSRMRINFEVSADESITHALAVPKIPELQLVRAAEHHRYRATHSHLQPRRV